MGVTTSLLKLYLVDQQLRGLRGRLSGAESFFKQQEAELSALEKNLSSIRTQVKQLEAKEHNDETEVTSLELRITELRERMNNARTSKEHAALLSEINTLKADRSLIEDRAIGYLTTLEQLRSQASELETQIEEKRKIVMHAKAERDAREAEIKDRVAELEKERAERAAEVPAPALAIYNERLTTGFEDVMAPCEEQSRRNLEYSCGSCFTHVPVEQVNILLNRGDLTRCPACQVILYMEDSLRDSIQTAAAKKAAKASK